MNSNLSISSSNGLTRSIIMKPFIRDFLLFFAVAFALNAFLNSIYERNFNDVYNLKVNYLKENKANGYDVLFWGSSRIYRHIKPDLFDSICSKRQPVRSFNLGCPGALPPETYFLYEAFLKESGASAAKNNICYVLLEIHPYSEIAGVNQFAKQSYYWLNFKAFRTVVWHQLHESASFHKKCSNISRSALCYLLNTFGVNYLPNLLKEDDSRFLQTGQAGYYSLEQEERAHKGADNRLTRRRVDFQKDASKLSKRRESASRAFSKATFPPKEHYLIHLRHLESLMKRSEEEGIRLIFIIPPRCSEKEYEELLFIKSALSQERIIEVADPSRFPELWDAEGSFDIGHFNEKAAARYTEVLASEFLSLPQAK